MNLHFLIAFVVCLASYIVHTTAHFFEYRGYGSERLKVIRAFSLVIISIGYVAWGFMIRSDPIKLDIHSYIALPLGLLIGLIGLALFLLSTRAKKGFFELDCLVTKGIYSKIRNPMYLGIILLHIGFPIAAKSLLTLISAIIWISLILIWRYMEEKDLEKKFGKEYLQYKKTTFF